ncbi:solute carrier family 22 member 7-like [Gadus chalcogrammus]|uniref:solute carrier family 22 member 7-like n=1 Tax=Gadus chalcogrammus TaxID=1042646 RepID=UPI0024C2B17A|nr:solute carrier family 22 member 7-like [Gadus chalcogrammus]
MKFDKVLSKINGFGKFQIALMLVQGISRITLPCHFLMNNFIAVVPTHHCDLSSLEDGGLLGNLTQEQRLAVGVPVRGDGKLETCGMYSEPQYQLLLSPSNVTDHIPTVPCPSGWVYDNSTFQTTLVTEWDLVCSRKGLDKATATIFFIGVMFGAPTFGFLSDRFGRRRMLLVSYLATMFFAMVSSFSRTYLMFVIMRFLTGVAIAGISIISVVLNVEWCGVENRTFAGVIGSIDWTIGSMILCGVAYFINEWRVLIVAVTSPLILSVITWWWIPESARWLLANGRAEEAHYYIMKCAKINNRVNCVADVTPKSLLESAGIENEMKKYTILDLVKTPNMRKLVICSGVLWFGVAFTYYGISLNVTGFGLNPHLTQLVFSCTELPGKLIVYFSLNVVGRRPCQMAAIILTGVCIFINIFVPNDLWIIRTVVAVCGKGLAEAAFTIMFLFTAEFYPTVVRQNGIGYTSFVARLGVSIAPLIILLDDVWRLLPQVIYGAVAVVAGLVASKLPETQNTRMPEFIEDVEEPRRSTMKFENVLDDINGFGRFQKMIIAISFISRFSMPCHFMLNNFIAVVPSHHCNLTALYMDDWAFRNLTPEEQITVGVPLRDDGKLSSCQMYEEPQYHLLLGDSNDTQAEKVPCQGGWVFDNSTFKSTLASQWDLVCDQKGKDKQTGTIFFLGVMCGAMWFGSLSDRYGRRIMLLVSYVFATLFGMGSAFSVNYVMFAVMRFFTGFSITGIIIVTSVLNVEWVDIRHRKLVGVIDSLAWSFGNISFAGIAYLVRSWRLLAFSVTAPLLIPIFTWRWVPESARWLIANGKLAQAQTTLRLCAKMNQTEEFAETLTPEALSLVIKNEKKDRVYTYLDLVRTPVIRLLALRTAIVWFSVACCFYGISFDIGGFGLNIYLTQLTFGLIEIPAKFIVYYLLDKIGRRKTLGGALSFVGICILINIFIPREMATLRTVVAVLGKGFSSASFTTIVLYTSELYPTVVRQNGMGFNSAISRTAVAVTPIILMLDDVWESLPKVIFSSLAVVGSVVAWTLPETRDRCLPETIDDIENRRSGEKLLLPSKQCLAN